MQVEKTEETWSSESEEEIDVVVSLRTSVQISFVDKSGRVTRKIGKAIVVEESVNNSSAT